MSPMFFDAEKLMDRFNGSMTMSKQTKKEVMSIAVKSEKLHEVAEHLKNEMHFYHLSSITAVDLKSSFELVYHLWNPDDNLLIEITSKIDRKDCVIDSVMDIWNSANWHEREAYDLFGIIFRGHPEMERLLLPSNFSGYPFRRDFVSKDPPKMDVKVHYE